MTTTYHELSNGAPSPKFGRAKIVVPMNKMRITAQVLINYFEGTLMSEVVNRPKQSHMLKRPTTNKDFSSFPSLK